MRDVLRSCAYSHSESCSTNSCTPPIKASETMQISTKLPHFAFEIFYGPHVGLDFMMHRVFFVLVTNAKCVHCVSRAFGCYETALNGQAGML